MLALKTRRCVWLMLMDWKSELEIQQEMKREMSAMRVTTADRHIADGMDCLLMESEGQLLTMMAFIVFGAVLLPLAFEHVSMKTVILSLGFLTIVRILPIWLSLLGTGLKTSEKLFLGWFGPRGLASI